MEGDPPNDTPPPEKELTISDQLMTFSSKETASSKHLPKKSAMKGTKSKIKVRQSTPAPPTKGGGRKRFVPSPLPEDKQLRKRIDFGEEDGSPIASPKCKASIFPTTSKNDKGKDALEEEKSQDDGEEELEMAILEEIQHVSHEVPSLAGQNSDHAAGDESAGPKTTNTQPSQARPIVLGAAKGQGVLGEELVNLPDLALETKMLLESSLVSCHNGESHVSLAVGDTLQPNPTNFIHVASLESADMLDTLVAQPLLAAGAMETGRPLATTNRPSNPGSNSLLMSPSSAFKSYQVEFPPLERGRTLKIRDSFESGRLKGVAMAPRTQVNRGGGGSEPIASPASTLGEGGSEVRPKQTPHPDTTADHPKATTASTSNGSRPWGEKGTGVGPSGPVSGAETNKNPGNATTWSSMADMIKGVPDPNGPQVFMADKLQPIGLATVSNGMPAIYFSGMEIQKLAESVGHAIVGKFSHSIPTSGQINKALNNIKLQCGFTWKYINAKHILIQCEDLADYARLLGGPKGAPVWYIDRHPMRVFKWSPDFDAYCESPIAAIWCNLIGLPIHLYDQSALFAIGKLLGTPIQVDRATANKSRLSFARICIEIDITKPPPQEFVLDICGREMIQQVRWDKIPDYCRECKHVGHSSNVCYAVGRSERPPKRDYNKSSQSKSPQGDNGSTEKQAPEKATPNDNNEWRRQGKNKGRGSFPKSKAYGDKRVEPDWEGPDIVGEFHEDEEMEEGQQANHLVRSEEGATSSAMGPGEAVMSGEAHMDVRRGHSASPRRVDASSRGVSRGGSRGGGRHSMARGGRSADGWMGNVISTNKYYALMENGEFDVDGCGEMDAVEMDVRHGGDNAADIPILTDVNNRTMMDDQRIVLFQGGPSSPSGTTQTC